MSKRERERVCERKMEKRGRANAAEESAGGGGGYTQCAEEKKQPQRKEQRTKERERGGGRRLTAYRRFTKEDERGAQWPSERLKEAE